MSWKDDALVHAKDQDPKEAVGLLLNIRGKQKYYPCQNLAITSHQEFILNPEDYVKADNLGDIIAVVHSHPSTPPILSMMPVSEFMTLLTAPRAASSTPPTTSLTMQSRTPVTLSLTSFNRLFKV